MCYVYVLKSLKNGKRYVGSTSIKPKERTKQHNVGANRFTKGNRPWTLIYQEDYNNITDARKRERFLKSGAGRNQLDQFLK